MFTKKSSALLLFLVLALLPFKMASADTSISASSITNPVWTADNSPYVITGTIEIARGAVLKIEAGTEVRFNPGAKLLVSGELDVNGTTDNPVTMTLNMGATSTSGVWGGIEFNSSAVSATMANGQYVSGSIIKNAIIKFGQGIKCTDASPYITGSQILANVTGLEISGTKGASGGYTMDSSATSATSSIIPLYVTNNIFTDNTTAVLINRTNSQSYNLTPAGYSYFGPKITTAYLSNNSFNSNKIGVAVLSGDNNILINNTVKYNAGDGVQLMNTSRGNILERNTINNNKIGVEDASPDAVIIQNNIKNNFDIGLKISQKPNRFAFNNIYKNQNYNVGNQVYNLDATNNYWGSTDKTTIEAGFLTAATSTTATSTVSAGPANYPIIYIPFLTKETNTAAIFDPVIDSYSTSTVLTQVALTGLKPVGTDAYVNGAMIAVDNNSSTWNYNAILGLGDNSYTIYYSDSSGTRSNPLSLIIRRNNTLAAPVLNSYPTTTSSPSLVLTGTKPANTSLLINGVEVGALSAMTAWSYALPLDLGLNSVEVMAKDADGQYSAPIDFTVTRVKLSASDISAQEKIITTKVDAKLALKLAGQLLLQTENNGYIWYINPKDNKRYLVTFDNALALFKSFATGITEKNLNLIPTKESGQKGNAALRTKFKGKFLLRVEAAGQVSYVDLNGYRHDISADNLMANFRALSLGISNVNLRKITVGEVK